MIELKILENNYVTKKLELHKLEMNLDKITSDIKIIENITANTYKTFLENILEIISFGFSGYDKK